MTEQKEIPVGEGEGAQLPIEPQVSTTKDSQDLAKTQVLRTPFMTQPEPWPERVDGAELLDELVSLFRRHLSLPEGAAQALALWVLFTHCLDAFEVSPRLAILSPVPECGKTTVLKLLSRLVPTPLPTSNISSAVVYRVIKEERPTLLIDEADTFFDSNSEMTGILNSGHTRDAAFVWRCASAEKEYEPQYFSTWAAMAIAKIGKLPPALDSRSITISMQRARPDEQLDRLKKEQYHEIEILAQKASSWERLNRHQLQGAEPQVPEGLHNRAADNWRPLLAIAHSAGGHWPDTARQVALQLSGEAELPERVHLLIAIRSIFESTGVDRFSSADLCKKLSSADDQTWWTPNNLAREIKSFGIRPHGIRIDDKTPKGYYLSNFEDAFARYLPSKGELSPPPTENCNTAT
jgi:putative DNA primase/helicase